MPLSVAFHRSALVTAVIVLSLAMISGTLALRPVEVLASKTTAPSAVGPRAEGQRASDRAIERQVRRAIRADPSLALAAPRVKVTSRRGVVRLVGQVRTAKERSSIVFKAGQNAGGGRVDDRVTIGRGVEGEA